MYHLKSPWLFICCFFPNQTSAGKISMGAGHSVPNHQVWTTQQRREMPSSRAQVWIKFAILEAVKSYPWRHVIYLCILWLYYVYMFIFAFFTQSLLFGAFNMVSSFWYKMMCVMCRMFPTYHSIGRFWNGHSWLHPCWNVCVTNIQQNSACVPVVPLSWLNIHPIIVCFQLDSSASWWCGSLVFLDS